MIRLKLTFRALVCYLAGIVVGPGLASLAIDTNATPAIITYSWLVWLIALMFSAPALAAALLLVLIFPKSITAHPWRWSIVAALVLPALWLAGLAAVHRISNGRYGIGAASDLYVFGGAGFGCAIISAIVFYAWMRRWPLVLAEKTSA